VVYAILHQIPPFQFIDVAGRHIHHLAFGIIILLLVGYGWLYEIGVGSDHPSIFLSRLMSILYCVGAVLTPDEFALWLNLKDVVPPRKIEHRRQHSLRSTLSSRQLGCPVVSAKTK
jgi:hypothetical protein